MDASGTSQGDNTVAGNQAEGGWPARIIFGEPKSEDEFGGRGHERSARALADGIRQIAERTNGRQRAGGAIGLEGAWGSGKSTVIDIAKQKYLGPKYRIFTFDLWRHQSDDFRRSLLEQFIAFAREEFNPKGKDGRHIHGQDDARPKIDLDIDKKHDEIKNRKSITTTTSNRRLSLFAAILIILLPLMPLAYAALTRLIIGSPGALTTAAQAGAQSSPADTALLWLANPWTLGILAYVIAAFLLIVLAYRAPFDGKDSFNGKLKWFRGGVSRLLNLSERDSNNEVEQKIRDESPTTVEFRTVFEDILVPLQKADRHIIFVLDNVDRIPSADLSKTWAEVRSLVAGNGDISKQLGSVIAVVPYDKDHVSQAFPSVKVPKLIPRADGDDGEYEIDRKNGLELETDVFEKTFDRIVKVSAPVPSDWKHFLLKRIAEAGFAGAHGADHAEKLFRLLQFKLQRDGVHPTPRRIIAYVNDIGGLWAQWADSSIPIETVGLYVLHRSVFDRDPSILNKAQPVHIRFARIVDDPDYAKHLAALAFNVEPALADQVRLAIPITTALLDPNDEKGLISLSQSDGFYEIFQDVLRERVLEWAKDSPESIARAAVHVDAMELPADNEDAIWQIFGDGVVAIEELEYGQERLDGLYAIVRRQKRHRPETIAGRIRQKFEAAELVEGDANLFGKGASWYRLMYSLTQAIADATDAERANAFWDTEIPSQLPVFNLGVVSANDPASKFKFSDIALGCDTTALSNELVKMAAVNPEGYDFAIGVIGSRLTKHFPAQLEAIANQLGSIEPDERSIRLIHATAKIMESGVQVDAIPTAFAAVRGGALLNYARWANDSGEDEDLAVALIVLATAYDGALSRAPNGTKEAIAAEWYNSVLEGAVDLGEVPDIIADHVTRNAVSTWLRWAVSSKSDEGLYWQVIRAATKVRWVWFGDQVMIAKHFDRINTIVGGSGVSFFLRHIHDYQGRVKKDFGGSATKQVPSSMVKALAELDETVAARQILELIKEHLASLDAEEWFEALTAARHDGRRLLVAMREHTQGFELRSPAFMQGLVRASLSVLSEDLDPSPMAADWQYVFGAIPPSQYVPLRAQIVSGMRSTNVTGPGSIAFVQKFSTIAQKMRFSVDTPTADMALSHFLWHLANSNEEAARGYLDTQRKEIEATLKAASSDDIRKAFEDARRPEGGDNNA